MKPVSAKARHGLLLSSHSSSRMRRLLDCVAGSMQLFTVGFVIVILSGVMSVGFFGLLPNLYHTPWSLFCHQLIAIFLSINITVHYLMAALKGSKSHNATLPVTESKPVPKGIYEDYRYCLTCQSVKAPGAHHCRTCNACIDDMDHHCPFIGNCVGRKNLHNFLLFLFWTGVGAMYAMFVCLQIVVYAWPAIINRPRRHHDNLWSLTFTFSTTLPWWILAAFYMFVVCLTGSIGVFLLLGSQLRQIQRGQTYIEALKNGNSAGPRHDNIYLRLSRVLGRRNPVAWFFPCFFSKGLDYEAIPGKAS